MAVLVILLFQFTNKTNLTLPNQSRTPFPNPARGHQRPPSADLKLNFQHVVPDDLHLHGIKCFFLFCFLVFPICKFGYLYFLSFQLLTGPGLGAEIDHGMALTPFPSSIG